VKSVKNAFTLFEILVVILLIGVIASVFLPRMLRQRKPTLEWSVILDDLNNLVLFARQEAIANRQTYRLRFQANPKGRDTIRVEVEKDNPEKPGTKKYDVVSSYYFKTFYELEPQVRIKAVYLGKHEQLAENHGIAMCYVIPEGLVEDIMIHMVRNMNGVEVVMTYKMNPFAGKFEMLDGLVKPER
jgi:prepilin-type N-terminal cleavage/methylation domain-containing protein